MCSPSVKASLSTGSLVFVCSHYWQGFHVCRKRLSVKLLTNIGSSGLCILFRFLYLPCLISKKQMHISSCCKISLRRRHRSLHSSPPCPPTHNTNNGDTSKKNTAITGVFISYQCQEQSWRNMRKNTTGSRKDRERERERDWFEGLDSTSGDWGIHRRSARCNRFSVKYVHISQIFPDLVLTTCCFFCRIDTKGKRLCGVSKPSCRVGTALTLSDWITGTLREHATFRSEKKISVFSDVSIF